MQRRTPIIFLVAAVLAAGAAWLWVQGPLPAEGSDADRRLFPGLEQTLNDINRIRVEQRGRVYEVSRTKQQWQLPGKGAYPVLFERVKPLLLGIARLEKVEPQTNRPERYARLGVGEPSADSSATRVSLYADGADPVASLIVGRVRRGLIAGGRDGISIRVSGTPRAWLVAGRLDLPQRPVDWVDRQIIHIKPKTVRRITIRHPDGDTLVVEKRHRGARNFVLVNLPQGAGLKQGTDINLLARSLAGLKMDDVLIRAETPLDKARAVTAVFETWDGLQVTAYTVEQGNQVFAWFEVEVAALEAADLYGVRTTQTDVRALASRLDGWVYRIPPSRATKLRTRLDSLIERPHAAHP